MLGDHLKSSGLAIGHYDILLIQCRCARVYWQYTHNTYYAVLIGIFLGSAPHKQLSLSGISRAGKRHLGDFCLSRYGKREYT